MTIIVFLVDTSASMNQRTYLGTNLLDISKGAVENFMKVNGDGIAIQQMSVPQTSIKSISFC